MWYSKSMGGFSRKRFLVTLGLSVGIWMVSAIIQFLFKKDDFNYGFFIFAKSCEVTGYPFAKCIPEYDKGTLYLNYLVNITFWFWIIHLSWSFFAKRDFDKR